MTGQPWQSHATMSAHAAATRPGPFVDALRHDVVRQATTVLVDSSDLWDRGVRRAYVLQLLVESVTRQARMSGLGVVDIPSHRGAIA